MIDRWKPWYYAGPYVPSGILYGSGPSSSHWLIPGYEKAYEAFGVINLYNPPWWFK